MKKRFQGLTSALLGCALLLGATHSALADFELSDNTGRRILLKDDNTWSYIDSKTKDEGKAELQLIRRVEAPGGCRFDLTLSNNLPYEITSLVPDFAAIRANNVVYSTRLLGFGSLKPGDKLSRSLQFEGISCGDIAKLQVLGGDRCEMGELNKFSDVRNRCLALLRVLPSDLLKFEK
jgi:hypothetical protein